MIVDGVAHGPIVADFWYLQGRTSCGCGGLAPAYPSVRIGCHVGQTTPLQICRQRCRASSQAENVCISSTKTVYPYCCYLTTGACVLQMLDPLGIDRALQAGPIGYGSVSRSRRASTSRRNLSISLNKACRSSTVGLRPMSSSRSTSHTVFHVAVRAA